MFSDIAARGRSLGVHLILCTQRPAGVVRDAVMANCTLRICLRVNNSADSVEAIGTGAAAELTRLPLGRGFISASGEHPRLVQFALSDRDDAERVGSALAPAAGAQAVVRSVAHHHRPRPVARRTTEDGIGFGLADLPEEQRQPCAVYDPARHGNLLVIGAHGSGKSSVLAALQAGAQLDVAAGHSAADVQWIPSTVSGAWDCLTAVRQELRQPGGPGRLLLLDDVDALLGRFPEDYQRAFVDLLVAVLREGGSRSVHLVLTVQRSTAALQAVAALCDARMLLRLPDRQEHVMAGGTASDFVPEAAPGSALWHGHRVQVATVPVPPPPDAPEPPRLRLSGVGGVVVVSSRPRAFAQQLRTHPQIARVVELAGDRRHRHRRGRGRHRPRGGLRRRRGNLAVVLECAGAGARDAADAVRRLRGGGVPRHHPAEDAATTAGARFPDALWLKDADGNLSRVRL